MQIGFKNRILQEKLDEQKEREDAKAHPFPSEVRLWSIQEVGYFLTTLGLRQYRKAFEEAAVDGAFLLALDASDCADVLGVEHTLHLKKLFLAIDKLRPISHQEREKKVYLSLSLSIYIYVLADNSSVLCFFCTCLWLLALSGSRGVQAKERSKRNKSLVAMFLMPSPQRAIGR